MKRKSFLDEPALTIPLAMLAATFSFWSWNCHRYIPQQLGGSFIVMVTLAVVIFLPVRLLYKKIIREPSKIKKLTVDFFICFLAAEIALVLLSFTVDRLVYQIGLDHIYVHAAVVFGICLASCVGGYRIVNFFLGLWVCTALILGVKNMVFYEGQYEKPVDLRVELKRKPNIYLFYLESYHGFDVLENVYGIDVSPMRTFLDDNGFFVYEPVLANSFFTLGSMADTFTFQLLPPQPKNYVGEVAPEVRKAIGGDEYNALFRILKENGYSTTYLEDSMGADYYFSQKGPYLDNVSFDSFHLYFRPIFDLNEELFLKFYLYVSGFEKQMYYVKHLRAQVGLAMTRELSANRPFFLVFKGGAGHPSIDYPGTPEALEKEWKPEYQAKVADSDEATKTIVEYIISRDPDSVIIVIGDHGAQALGLFAFADLANKGDPERLRKALEEYDIRPDQLGDALFNVLLAIRLPEGKRDISHGLPINHVNLFRHIFAYLNYDPEILKSRAPALSTYGNIVLGRDNKPVFEKRGNQ